MNKGIRTTCLTTTWVSMGCKVSVLKRLVRTHALRLFVLKVYCTTSSYRSVTTFPIDIGVHPLSLPAPRLEHFLLIAAASAVPQFRQHRGAMVIKCYYAQQICFKDSRHRPLHQTLRT